LLRFAPQVEGHLLLQQAKQHGLGWEEENMSMTKNKSDWKE
jgi:hypothetical protein